MSRLTESEEAEISDWVFQGSGGDDALYGIVERIIERQTAVALNTARRYGGIDGGHHKMWVIDQMVQALLGDGYEAWVKEAKGEFDEEEEEYEYEWDEGIAP